MYSRLSVTKKVGAKQRPQKETKMITSNQTVYDALRAAEQTNYEAQQILSGEINEQCRIFIKKQIEQVDRYRAEGVPDEMIEYVMMSSLKSLLNDILYNCAKVNMTSV